jgi:putative ABC transport system permease protein
MTFLYAILEQSFIFLPLSMGIYISYSILKITDLTIDGSFILGAGVFSRLVTEYLSPGLSLGLGIAAGGCAGVGVGYIQRQGKIPSLTAGILALYILYSLNFKIMGKPNISLYGYPTLISYFEGLGEKGVLFTMSVGGLCLLGFFILFLNSKAGLLLRALGANPRHLHKMGFQTGILKAVGLALGNGLAAFGGIITTQANGYVDLGMGFGVTLTGIGAVVIGEQILKKFYPSDVFNPFLGVLSCFIGVAIYFFLINGFLALDLDPIYLKLLLGVFLVFLLKATPQSQEVSYA